MTINNIFFIYTVLSFFIMVVLIILTVYNYLSCMSLKCLYEKIKTEKQTNKKQDNNINNKTQLIMETKNSPSYNVGWCSTKYKKTTKTVSK